MNNYFSELSLQLNDSKKYVFVEIRFWEKRLHFLIKQTNNNNKKNIKNSTL